MAAARVLRDMPVTSAVVIWKGHNELKNVVNGYKNP